MPQLLYYVEKANLKRDGEIWNVHEITSGGLPALYHNEKKAKLYAARLAEHYLRAGWMGATGNNDTSIDLVSHDGTQLVCIHVREVRVRT